MRIAVLRANALGDLVFALPALESLRAAYPAAGIVLLARPLHARLLAGRPGPVDRVEVVPNAAGLVDGPPAPEAEVEEFLARMRAEEFDLAIQMHGGGRHSNPFVRRLGARLTVGLRTPDATPLDRWLPYVYYQHEVMRYLELVVLAGAPAVTTQPRLEVTAADRHEAAEVAGRGGGPLAILHPGASDVRRRWPVERFAAVGDGLAGSGARVCVTGTAGERETVDRVLQAMRAPAIDACDRLSPGGLAGLLAGAAVVVSNDTGPLHLADAVGARTVGVYWCGNLVNGAPLFRARHRPFASWQRTCPVCGTDCIRGACEHRVSFVEEVTVEEVLDAACDLLDAARAAA